MIGARDVAFPRLNALELLDLPLRRVASSTSAGSSGGAPERRLVRLREPDDPCSIRPATTSDFWVVGLQMLGIASLIAAI